MKIFKKTQIAIFLLMMITAMFTACGDDNNGTSITPSTIIFADNEKSIALNGGPYVNTVSGEGTGAITYSSETTETATINVSTGEVTLHAVGTTVITAEKEATETHAAVTATYTLTVTPGILYSIGDIGPSGVGKVFYITDGGLHGLEAAPSTWNGGSEDPAEQWSSIISPPYAGTSTDIGKGFENTYTYMTGNEYPAAALCRAYSGGTKTDWFLPSKDELNELFPQRTVFGNFKQLDYWSSSEYSSSFPGYAWAQFFGQDLNDPNFPNNQIYYTKNHALRVRPVRAF